jgi:5-methylcytosine-specific restriction protein B
MAIPSEITAAHVRKAIGRVRRERIPSKRRSTRYDVVVDGEAFPPKYVLSVACEVATGHPLQPGSFSGGAEANGLLRQLGFTIVDKRGRAIASP